MTIFCLHHEDHSVRVERRKGLDYAVPFCLGCQQSRGDGELLIDLFEEAAGVR